MRLRTGLAPVKVPLPGHEDAWVSVRRMKRSERNRYRELGEQGDTGGQADHLLKSSIVDFLLPNCGRTEAVEGDPIRANVDSAEERMKQLEEVDEELEDWLLVEAWRINGFTAQVELAEAQRRGVKLTPEMIRDLAGRELSEWRDILGGCEPSPEDTGEGSESTPSSEPRPTPE